MRKNKIYIIFVVLFLSIGLYLFDNSYDVAETSLLSSDVSYSNTNQLFESNSLPSYYNLKNSININVKSQGNVGSCWTFASITALETYESKNKSKNYLFSTRHMDYSTANNFLNNEKNNTAYNRNSGTGGNNYIAGNYLVSNLGPVYESDMPFENNSNSINLSDVKNKNVVIDVNDVYINGLYNNSSRTSCSSDSINQIKNLVYNYGSVSASIYMETSNYVFYNSNKSSLNVNNTSTDYKANHAISIVGWNDNYSLSNFNNKPSENGAWIVQNSYGTEWGDNGYFYVSYEDTNICNSYMAIMSSDDEVEDNLYSIDELGYNQSYGYKVSGRRYGYGLNIFTKSNKTIEEIKEITFASNTTGTYEIYYYLGNAYTDKIDRSKYTLISSGNIDHPGYTTYKLTNSIILEKNVTEFSIMIYYSTTSDINPIGASKKTDLWSTMTVEKNKSFVSKNPYGWDNTNDINTSTWYDLYNLDSEVSIKVATNTLNNVTNYKSITLSNNELSTIENSTVTFNNNSYINNIDISCTSSDVNCIVNFDELTITSSNQNVARVNSNNTISILSSGESTIKIETLNGIVKYFNIKSYGVIQSIVINNNNNISVEKYKTINLTATISPTLVYQDKTITWSSNNTNIATIDQNGKLYAKNIGSCNITAKTSNGKTSTIVVKVTKVNANSVTVSSISNKAYTGKQIKPTIKITYSGKTLKLKTDYTVSYGKNKSTGIGSIKITFKGNYTGTKTVYFYIVPKKVSIKTPKSTVKSTLTAYYYKTTGASGYQIAYRLKGSSTWSYATSTGASKKITKLKSKKYYQVKVRAYKTYKGKKYYGSWSSTKTIKTK